MILSLYRFHLINKKKYLYILLLGQRRQDIAFCAEGTFTGGGRTAQLSTREETFDDSLFSAYSLSGSQGTSCTRTRCWSPLPIHTQQLMLYSPSSVLDLVYYHERSVGSGPFSSCAILYNCCRPAGRQALLHKIIGKRRGLSRINKRRILPGRRWLICDPGISRGQRGIASASASIRNARFGWNNSKASSVS